MSDLIRRFRDYQIEWLTAHNDIEFCEEEEKLIIGFLKDTAESFVRENQSAKMDDLISRQAAIDTVRHAWAKGLEPSQYIEELPSAQPDAPDIYVGDMIYRQAAVDAIDALHDKPNAWLDSAVDAVMDLPSAQPEPSDAVYRLYKRAYEAGQRNAQPEIVRCKDCEYGEQDEIGRWYCRGLGCQIGDDDGSGFCSDAERRE